MEQSVFTDRKTFQINSNSEVFLIKILHHLMIVFKLL